MSVEEILLKDNEYKVVGETDSYKVDEVRFDMQEHPKRDLGLQQKIDERWDLALKQNPKMRNNPAIAVDFYSRDALYLRFLDPPNQDKFCLNVRVYESCYKDMFATSRENADANSVFLVGSKGLYMFPFGGRNYLLFGLRNASHANIKGRTQAMPAGMMNKEDLAGTSFNQQLETMRREYEEELVSMKNADGLIVSDNKAFSERWSTDIQKFFLGFSLHPTLGSFDADYILVDNNEEWVWQHRITKEGYLLELEKLDGKFTEHEIVFGVATDSISDFVEDSKENISVASRWLLWRALRDRPDLFK